MEQPPDPRDRREYWKQWYSKNTERHKAYNKQYVSENRDKVNEYKRKWCKKRYPVVGKESRRIRYLKDRERLKKKYQDNKYEIAHKERLRKYKLTREEYITMLIEQENACAICRISFEECKPHCDHDHSNGKVRGILCLRCNSFLGFAGDSVNTLFAGIRYLERASL